MTPCVQFERDLHQLRFEELPMASIVYQEEDPKDDVSFLRLEVMDAQTEQIEAIFLRTFDLRNLGISLTVLRNLSHDPQQVSTLLQTVSEIGWFLQRAAPVVSQHMASKYASFFREHALDINREICYAIHRKIGHISWMGGAPGIYLSHFEPSLNIFINLKTRPLSRGTFGEIRTVLWLNAPRKSSFIVAKKGLRSNEPDYCSTFKTEIDALRRFSGQRGIISLLSGGEYTGKYAIFLPLYECTLWQCFQQSEFPLLTSEILSVTSQWLNGLAIISEEGIHGDLHPKNLLLRHTAKGIEGVIADFGTYRLYSEAQYGLTTLRVAPPEYCERELVTVKHDVWAMGICLLGMFTKKKVPCFLLKTAEEIKLWISKLTADWSLECATRPNTPPFLLRLINEMLDPCAEGRPTPKEAFERFLSFYPDM
jgi:hypothetical protein